MFHIPNSFVDISLPMHARVCGLATMINDLRHFQWLDVKKILFELLQNLRFKIAIFLNIADTPSYIRIWSGVDRYVMANAFLQTDRINDANTATLNIISTNDSSIHVAGTNVRSPVLENDVNSSDC